MLEYCAHPLWSCVAWKEVVNPEPAVKVPALTRSVAPIRKLPAEKDAGVVEIGEYCACPIPLLELSVVTPEISYA